MKKILICTVVFALISSLGAVSVVRAQNDYPTNTDRIRVEQERAVKDWIDLGKEHLESFKSPLIDAGKLSTKLSNECIEHLKQERQQIREKHYSKEAWIHHVFECEKCCANLLLELMAMHVQHVIEQPHVMVLFDFDTFQIKDTFKKMLNELAVNHYNKDKDKVLLIGRASKVGDRAYNIALSGKRAGEVKDYFMDEFGIDDARIRFLFFGYDPPQLTANYAKAYGLTPDQLASIDVSLPFENPDINKINQSVIVIFYSEQDSAKHAEKK